MADNVVANAGSGGSTFAAPELSFSGDTVKLPISALGILSGSEGAWTFTLYTGGAGAVTAGTPRVTLASDDPAVSSLASIKTAVETLDNAISGSEMQVDVVAALPAGTNAIGKLAANSGVDIGDVDVTSVPTDPFGANADAASSTGSISAKLRFIATTGIPVTGTVTVGSHAVTNAGTFVVQVDGAALTALQKIDDPVIVDDAAFTPATSSVMMFGAEFDDTAPDSVDEGDAGAVRMSANRCLYVNLRDNAGNERGLNIDASGNLTANITGTVTVGSHAVTNAGTFVVQVDGSALTALQKIDDPVLVDDAAFTPATSSVMMAGFEADETATDSVDEGDAGAARMTLDRKQIVTPQPHTAGGFSIFRSLDLDETEEDIKTSAGQLYGWYIFNASTSIRYVKFYNDTAANVIVGTTTPALTIPVPAATSGGVGMVFSVPGTHGIAFSTAICAAATTGLADADTGAPAANDVVINALYK